ncbi:MAG: hypothetical protein WBF80_13970 [Rhodococcus sp. (in: high G+C Gram-positive bacteria)]
MSSSESSTAALSEIDSLELAVLTELCSPEAVAAFEMMHASIRPSNAARFADLLSIINGLSGPNFADAASLNLLEAIEDSSDLEFVESVASRLDHPLTALSVAQLLRTYHRA